MYLSVKSLETEYDISTSTVNRVIRLIRENIGVRYPEDRLIEFGGKVRVDNDTFRDALMHRDEIVRGLS